MTQTKLILDALLHTPGPWKHCFLEGGWDGVSEEGGMVLCRLDFNNPANASLMAASPDLLELAYAFLSYLEDQSNSPRRRQACMQAARAAIQKATKP
jgi:hypothetical protein